MNQLSLYADEKLDDQSVKFQVDGKILNELSKQVTSHIFALGELIKNSYDAQATYIKITFDLNKSLLTIDDNGTGISKENIQSLLHIAKSNKKYAEKFTFNVNNRKIDRYTQGSKGLGLFSAFKFGNIVNWDTKCENSDAISLTVDKEKVIKLSNISNAIYKLETGKRKNRGTTITIKLDNYDKEIIFTYNHLKAQINTKRLVNFFLDDSLIIDFNLIKKDGTIESNFPIKTVTNKELEEEFFKINLFKIIFSSKEGKIDYFYKNQKKSFKEFTYELKNKAYTIKFTIYAFIFKAGGKKAINSLFLNSRSDLTPLIYINGALFNNDNIFDPSITRKIKSSKTLSQLVGFIDITCTHPDLQFNNERTDLIFNSFNEELKEDLKKINIFIQEKGKYLEKNLPTTIEDEQLDESESSTESKPDESESSAEPKPDENESSAESKPDESESSAEPKPDENETNTDSDIKGLIEANHIPFIKLKHKEKIIRFSDQSEIIDLNTFLHEAKDSTGKTLSPSQLKISIDSKILSSPLLTHIDQSKTLQIKFFFEDPILKDHHENNFICSEILTLTFQKKKTHFNSNDEKYLLIEPLGYKEYKIKLERVDRLIQQINELYNNYNNFDMCIASAVRLVFDLTTYRYQQLHPKQKYKNTALESQVEEIIEIIRSDNHHFTQVAALLDARHKVNKNIFDPGLFAKKVEISNLGSHTGSSHLSIETIKDIAKYAGYYAQLVDAHCKVMGLIEK
ncbi:MAG TPA: ATP-binding protein [Acinetobacter towneri]|nr:ATP-binding protein [Acinetobacter towneri]